MWVALDPYNDPYWEMNGRNEWTPWTVFQTSSDQVAFPLAFAWNIMAQSLTWLMLITKAIGKYPMNGYSVVKEQRIFQKKDPSLYLPLSEGSDNR